MKPLKDWVHILPESESDGLIKIPGDKRPERGKVVAVGPGRRNKYGEKLPMSVKVGDKVFIGDGGYHFPYKGIDYYHIREPQISAIEEV